MLDYQVNVLDTCWRNAIDFVLNRAMSFYGENLIERILAEIGHNSVVNVIVTDSIMNRIATFSRGGST